MTAARAGRLALGLAALAASAGLFYLSGPLQPVWWVAWIAPALALGLAYRSHAAIAAIAVFAAALCAELSLCRYLRLLIDDGLPLSQAASMVLMPAVGLTGAALLARAVARRGHLVLAALAFGFAWAGFEFVVAATSPNGTFQDYAYTQADTLPVLQIASVTGLWGLDFLVMATAASLAALVAQAPARARAAPIVLMGFMLAAVVAWGSARLAQADRPGRLLVGGLVSDVGLGGGAHPLAARLTYVDRYVDQVHALAARGATAVVLPENLVKVSAAEGAEVMRRLSAAAAQDRLTLVSGVHRIDASASHNSAVAFGADGKQLLTYDKQHLFPGTPDMPGHAPGVWKTAAGPEAVEICKDLDFAEPSRAYGRAGVRVVFAPASDYGLDGPMHASMAVVRSVEDGFALVRTARHGLVSISDDRGRRLAQRPSSAADFVEDAGAVRGGTGPTPYARFGDWFPYLSLAFTAAVALWLALPYARRAALRR